MSGIYIPGMEMPKSCRDCGIEQDGFWCGALDGYQNTRCFTNERREDCPLVEISDEKIVKVATLEDVREAVDWAVGEIKSGMDWVETKDLKGYPLKKIIAMAESEGE